MKTLLIAIPALALMALPASALTLEQAMDSLAGMYCSGSSCTSEATVTQTSTTPDTYVSTGSKSQSDGAVASDKCTMGVIGKPGVRIQTPNVDANCTPLSISSTGSGYSVPGVTSTSESCTVTTKTLSYNGPTTSRDTAWSVDSSSSSSSGAC